jgi:hypothetical protein
MSGEGLGILQKSLLVVIEVAVPVLLAWGVAELKVHLKRVRQRDEWWVIEEAVSRAVTAAEQLGLTDELEEWGETKLDAALLFVERELAARGVPLDLHEYAEVIRAMIEAEVRRQFPNEIEG